MTDPSPSVGVTASQLARNAAVSREAYAKKLQERRQRLLPMWLGVVATKLGVQEDLYANQPETTPSYIRITLNDLALERKDLPSGRDDAKAIEEALRKDGFTAKCYAGDLNRLEVTWSWEEWEESPAPPPQ
jgi:hypothetical protein